MFWKKKKKLIKCFKNEKFSAQIFTFDVAAMFNKCEDGQKSSKVAITLMKAQFL